MRMKPPVVAAEAVLVEQQRRAGAQPHAADLVEAQLRGRLVAVERVDVDAVAQVVDDGLARVRVVCLMAVARALPQGRVGHPADHRLEAPGSTVGWLCGRQIMSPRRDVDVVLELA